MPVAGFPGWGCPGSGYPLKGRRCSGTSLGGEGLEKGIAAASMGRYPLEALPDREGPWRLGSKVPLLWTSEADHLRGTGNAVKRSVLSGLVCESKL
jgi:hypothetical protein